MKVLVTGSTGMIGSHLIKTLLDEGFDVVGVSRREQAVSDSHYIHYAVDLSDIMLLRKIFCEQEKQGRRIDRVIHLAALAHTEGESDLSWDRYYQENVIGAVNLFTVSFENKCPVLFSSTVDVYGFTNGVVSEKTQPHPISDYGKSKWYAELELQRLGDAFQVPYSIYRFSPVYTATTKRDIQKRYYLKYPTVAYKIGKGTEFEILSIENAVRSVLMWCKKEPRNEVEILKDPLLMNTRNYIRAERAAGRAKVVLWFPRWLVVAGYVILVSVFGTNEKTYLLNKAVHPLRSE